MYATFWAKIAARLAWERGLQRGAGARLEQNTECVDVCLVTNLGLGVAAVEGKLERRKVHDLRDVQGCRRGHAEQERDD